MPSPSPIADVNLARPVPDGAFGRYRLFAKLGSGGQADVYLAIARGTLGVDKLVVIKRAKPGLAADAERLGVFLDEARLTLRLNHPNLVHTYEVGEENGAHFLSMEHVEGLSLKEMFRSEHTRAFGAAIWLRVIADALSGLSHAHSLCDYDGKPMAIVHRDISPHNIAVSYDGVTKLLDFGIATSRHGSAAEPGVLTGKAAYMAPEQALGQVGADRRSDLFAMGVVLWEMLSGRRMFDGDAASVLHRLAHEPIARLASVMPGVDPELDDLVARALEKDPAARYQTANEMRQAIERYLRKAGHVVRELEVGEAMATAFADVRAALQARILEAMSGLSEPPRRTAELPGVTGDLAGELEPALRVRHSTPNLDRAITPPVAHDVSPRRAPLRRTWIVAALAVGVVGGAALVLVPRRGAPPAARVVALPPHEPVASLCPTPIRVRVMYDMTGDTKDVGTPAGKGESDYLRAINAAGGIRGCKLDIDIQDTRYDKRASLDVYRAWQARPDWAEVSTVFLQGTPMTQALGPLAAQDGKVVMSSAYAGELAAPVATSVDVAVPSLNGAFAEASVLVRKQSPGYSNVFFQGTDYTTAARVAANFAWRQGAKRMAFFYCSKSSFCTDPVDGAKTFLTLLGGTKIGRDLFLELGDDAPTIERKVMQFFQQERQYKASHPDYEIADWIWFGNTSTDTATLGRAIKKAKETYGLAIHLIGNNWSVDEALYSRCGDACVGFNVVQPYGLFGDLTTSGTQRLLADHATYRKLDGEPADAYKAVQYIYGRVAVGTWKIAVERLLDQGKPVTGANLRAMLETFHNVDIEGFATIGYTPTDHRPQSGARVTQLGPHGRLESVGQPLSLSLQAGWLGW
jgi:Protein kinase domain/Periplasmic binding protein